MQNPASKVPDEKAGTDHGSRRFAHNRGLSRLVPAEVRG